MELLTTKYADKIEGFRSCFDRMIIKGFYPMFVMQIPCQGIYLNKISFCSTIQNIQTLCMKNSV
jgi:hypothetical protein